jgi:hypothetical protein
MARSTDHCARRKCLLTNGRRSRPVAIGMTALNLTLSLSSFLLCSLPRSFHLSLSHFDSFLSTAVVFSARGPKEDINFTGKITERTTRDWHNVTLFDCFFEKCKGDKGGGFFSSYSNVTIFDTIFQNNQARIGGGAHILNSDVIYVRRMIVNRNNAEYDGGFCADTEYEGNASDVNTVNVTFNRAEKWTGGFRIDHAGGNLTFCYFEGNSAVVCGGFFDFAWGPSVREVSYCVFKNNSSVSRGGAYTAFHILHLSQFSEVVFVQNFCNLSADSISVESIEAVVDVKGCTFDGPEEKEVAMRFPGESNLTITESEFGVGGDRLKEIFERVAKPIRDGLEKLARRR